MLRKRSCVGDNAMFVRNSVKRKLLERKRQVGFKDNSEKSKRNFWFKACLCLVTGV